MRFKIGQEVVCVNDSRMNPAYDVVKEGMIYTVLCEMGVQSDGNMTICLTEFGQRTSFWEEIFEPLEDEAYELVEEVKENLKHPEPCL